MIFFITGAKGFLGRHLSRQLGSINGNIVVGLGHGNWAQQEYSQWGLKDWVDGDISQANLNLLAERHGAPTSIFHLAGGSSVGPSLHDPLRDFERSVVSTANVFNWIKCHSTSTSAILSSSAAVYGSGHSGAIIENAELNPYSPYGAHKRMCELTFETYAKSFNLKSIIIRFFSIYGPELRKQLLWDICTKLSTQENHLILGGTGHELRDWLHVEDACRLLSTAMQHASNSCPIVNGGTNHGTTVRSIAETIIDLWGSSSSLAFSGLSRPGDPPCLVADTSLSRAFGFEASRELTHGLDEYVSWFKKELRNK
ncbi:NAD-dependent epimerase/dehydratase family protein [Pseudomonas sp. GCM10022186]|uniref:NAD-dependent epimerase/dehydratase family protein n=1 Tax=Pseudomonas sp. GCM10022186 TaxID=3252650 RepID=UPI003616FCDF